MTLGDVTLRPLEPRDIPRLQQFRNDPGVRNELGGFSTGYSQADLEDWLSRHRGKSDEILWAIAMAEDDLFVGHVGLYQIDYRVGKAEFGILIGDTAFQNRGIGRRVTEAVVTYGFNELRLNKVSLQVVESNHRAIRLYERVGFVREGLLVADQFRNGQFLNVVLMAKFARDSHRGV